MAPLSKGWKGKGEREGEEEREEGSDTYALLGAGVGDDVVYLPHKVLGLRSMSGLVEREKGTKEREKAGKEREKVGPKGIKAKSPFVKKTEGIGDVMGSLRTTITSTVCGSKYTFAISESGDVFAWGNGPLGLSGATPNPFYSEFPIPISSHFKGVVTQICTAPQYCVALTQVWIIFRT
jgi:hypothetical protein